MASRAAWDDSGGMGTDLHLESADDAMLAVAPFRATSQRDLAHALTATAHHPFALGAVLDILITAAALRCCAEGTSCRREGVR